MHVILDKALTATAAYWPSLVLFFTWLGQATAILDNPAGQRALAARGHKLAEQLSIERILRAYETVFADLACR